MIKTHHVFGEEKSTSTVYRKKRSRHSRAQLLGSCFLKRFAIFPSQGISGTGMCRHINISNGTWWLITCNYCWLTGITVLILYLLPSLNEWHPGIVIHATIRGRPLIVWGHGENCKRPISKVPWELQLEGLWEKKNVKIHTRLRDDRWLTPKLGLLFIGKDF